MSLEISKKEEVTTLEANEKLEVSTIETEKGDQEFAAEILSKIENEINAESSSQAEIQKIDSSIKFTDPTIKEKIKNELDLENKLTDLNSETKTAGEKAKSEISDKVSENKTSPETIKVNHENASLVLFERMNNDDIKKQLINLLMLAEDYKTKQEDIKIVYDENGDIRIGENGKPITEKIPSSYKPKTYEELEAKLEDSLSLVKESTPISFDPEEITSADLGRENGGRELMALNDKFLSTEAITPQQRSIAEAHEKGHVLRPYGGEFFREYFAPAFDLSKIEITPEDFEKIKKLSNLQGEENMTYENSKEQAREEKILYLFSGAEIAERMSQLKNYFGIKGNEKFTKENLYYAKDNYIKDTNMNNDMTFFFKAITPQKEDEFIKLINSSGI